MIKIDKESLYEIYMEKINQISDDLENKTHFSPKEIIQIITDILENNSSLFQTNTNKG